MPNNFSIGMNLAARRRGTSPDAIITYLFTNSEQGIWLDPSDLTTMFQDAAGTVPVTADGQPVGLVLDKRLWGGKTLAQVLAGQPNLLIPGAWLTSSAGASVATESPPGTLNLTGDGTNSAIGDQSFATTAGVRYWLQIDVSSQVAALYIGTSQGGLNILAATAGTGAGKIFSFVASGAATWIRFYRNGPGTSVISNIQCRAIPGNHASQSTVASKPTYRNTPDPLFMAGQPELVVNGDFSTGDVTGWTKTAGDGTVAVVGGKLRVTTSTTVGSNVFVSQSFSTTIGKTYLVVGSMWTGPTVVNFKALRKADNPSPGANTVDIISTSSPDFAAVNKNATFVATATTTYIVLQVNANGNVTYADFDNISLKEVPANAPLVHYLAFDGVDDYLFLPNLNLGTDKATIFMGAYRANDTTGIVYELSNNWNLNAGSFAQTNAAAPQYWTASSRGDAAGSGSQVAYTSQAGADTAVITALHDISGDLSRVRRNGVVGTDGTGDKGTGNFGSYPLRIGIRGDGTLPFNGRIYGLIIRGALTADPQLINTEIWLRKKTGVTW